MTNNWAPSSWRELEIKQQPIYKRFKELKVENGVLYTFPAS